MAVVDRKGHVNVHFKVGLPRLVLNLIDETAYEGAETGMLSAALDPDYEGLPFLYVYYSVRGEGEKTRLSRFTIVDGGARRDTELVILEIPQPADIHNGGDIEFGSDGMLYLGLGDGGPVWEKQSQRVDTFLGSIIRIDVRGATEEQPYKVPSDNPLVANPDARPEIWAWGLRNPWRMDIDPESGKIWVGDVGWARVEEITVVEAGTNHGWHLFEGSECRVSGETGVTEEDCNDARDEMIFPVHEYLHPGNGCAVIGGYVYRGTAIPWLQGAYIFGDFCTSKIWALTPVGESEWWSQHMLTVEPHRRITSFASDEEGEIYILTLDGPILKIVGASNVAD